MFSAMIILVAKNSNIKYHLIFFPTILLQKITYHVKDRYLTTIKVVAKNAKGVGTTLFRCN